VRLFIQSQDLRRRTQESAMGSSLLNLRQRPLSHVPTAHLQGLVVRTTSHQAVHLSSGTPEGAVRICVGRSLPGDRNPRLYRVPHRRPHLSSSTPYKPWKPQSRPSRTSMESDNLRDITEEQRDIVDSNLADLLLFLFSESDIHLDQPDSAL